MTLHNATNLKAGYTLGLEKSGHHCLIVVAKATYALPSKSNEEAKLLEEEKQIELFETDTFTGEAGESAPVYENDYPPVKLMCDVILNGSAYAYPHKEVDRQVVKLRISTLKKSFLVFGERVYYDVGFTVRESSAKSFTKQSIGYDNAYGGTDLNKNKSSQEEEVYSAYVKNPVGRGYAPHKSRRELHNQPVAITESLGRGEASTPQSFGGVGRNWYPRHTFGGTYDAHWDEHVKPFLPKDFDEHYYQFAPKDQQIPYIVGGEKLYLEGLLPHTETLAFNLPSLEIPMEVIKSNGQRESLIPVIDTLTIEPDENHFTLVYRAKIKLKRSIHEVDTIIVGEPNDLWEKKRLYGECYEEPETEDEENNNKEKSKLSKEQRNG